MSESTHTSSPHLQFAGYDCFVTETERPAVESWLATCPYPLALQVDPICGKPYFQTAGAAQELKDLRATKIAALRAHVAGGAE